MCNALIIRRQRDLAYLIEFDDANEFSTARAFHKARRLLQEDQDARVRLFRKVPGFCLGELAHNNKGETNQ